MTTNAKSSATNFRSHADYAIEFGEHLAKAAESFLSAYNRVAQMELDADHPAELHDYDAAAESRADAYKDLTNAIYEFRKRAERARSTPSETASPTDDEIRQAIFAYEGALAEEDDDAGLQAARDALLDMMKRCRDGRPAVTETVSFTIYKGLCVSPTKCREAGKCLGPCERIEAQEAKRG